MQGRRWRWDAFFVHRSLRTCGVGPTKLWAPLDSGVQMHPGYSTLSPDSSRLGCFQSFAVTN